MAGSKNLTRLNVVLTAAIGPFASAMGGASSMVDKFGGSLKNALLSPIGLITSALSAGAFIAGIKNAAQRIDDIAKSADRLGISTQSFVGLSHAAELSGSSAEELRGGMEKLTKKVEEAAQGSKTAQASFTAMGLSVQQLAGMAPDEQFKAVADAVNGLGTQGQKTAAIMDVFGKSGGNLTATLAEGSAGLNAMTEEAVKLGIAVTRVDAAKIENANDALSKAHEVLQGVFDKIAVKIAPFVEAIANAFVDTAKSTNGFGNVIDNVMNFAIKAAGFVADAWQGLKIIWHALLIGVAELGKGILKVADWADFAAKWWAAKFKQAIDAVMASWEAMKAGFAVIWAAMKIPFAHFVQFIGGQLAVMLQNFAAASARVAPEMSKSLQEAGLAIGVSTGDMAAKADKDFDKMSSAAVTAGENQKAAWGALFSNVEVKHSETIQQMIDDEDAFASEHADAIQGIAAEGPASESFEPLLLEIQQKAEIKGQARADEIEAEQQHQRELAAIQSQGTQMSWEQWSEDIDQRITRQQKYWNTLLSGQSQFFGNLGKLTQSHSKTAQRIGRIAGKAQIGIDTAQAAMAGYKNGMIAGGPYFGPVLAAIYAGAAIAAGAVQLGNLDSAASGGAAAPAAASASSSIGPAGPAGGGASNGQQLIVQGDFLSADSLVNIFKEAKERGIAIEGVRRG